MGSWLLIFPALHALQVIKWCFYGWKHQTSLENYDGKISWIVPFKNEGKNLEEFFRSVVTQQKFPHELILVDDGSKDDSVAIIETWIPKIPFPTVLVKNRGVGKKSAITQAIEIAEGEVMVCSDADCTFDPHYLHFISQPFSQPKVVWVSGRVVFKSDGSFWKEVLATENEGLQAITAASIRGHRPTMANGAAMAFRKEVFQKVHGYQGLEHLASGDDELLLHRIAGNGPLVYAKNAVVETHSVASWKEFWKQRKRWVGKSGDYENKRMQGAMLVAWLARFSWLIFLFGWNFFGTEVVLISTALLFLPEFFLLQLWGITGTRAALQLLVQGIYSLYVFIIPFLSKFSRK